MADFREMTISGSDFDEFSNSLTSIIQALPEDMRKYLMDIRSEYFGAYGFKGAMKRLNNRSVSQIIEEYRPTDAKVIAAGEVDGVKYQLYDAPSKRGSGKHRGAT